MNRLLRGFGRFLLLLPPLLALARAPVDSGANPADSTLTPSRLDALRARIEAAADLSDEQRKQLNARLVEATALLGQAARERDEVARLRKTIDTAPVRIEALKKSGAAGKMPAAESIAKWDTARIDKRLRQRQATLDAARARLAAVEKQLAAYATDARDGGAELADARSQLAALNQAAPVKNGNLEDATRQALRRARRQMLRARIEALSMRQGNLDRLTGLAQAERDALTRRVKRLESETDRLRKVLQQRREAMVRKARKDALAASNEAPPALREVQQRIAALVAERGRLIEGDGVIDRKTETVRNLLNELRNDRERIVHALKIVGDSEEVSTLLLKHRRLIPSLGGLTRELLDYQRRINDAVLRQLQLDEALRDSADGDRWVADLLAKAGVDAEQARILRKRALAAWRKLRGAMLELMKAYNRHVAKLSTLESQTRELLEVARDYRAYIDEQLLWMPSTDPVPLTQPELLAEGALWLTDPANLVQLRDDAGRAWRMRPLWVLAWVLAVLLPLWLRRRAHRLLAATAEATRRVRTDSFGATLSALFATLALVLPMPLLMLGAGWLLASLRAAGVYTVSVAAGLQGAGHLILFLGVLRHLTRDNGLAPAHLRWREPVCERLGAQATWLLMLGPPLIFLVSASAVQVPSSFIRLATPVELENPGLLALGRLAFVAIMLLVAVAVQRIWSKRSPLFDPTRNDAVDGRWATYHFLWFPLALLLPLALSAAALAGYYYTALFLSSKFAETLWFVLGLVLLRDLLYRGLYVTQRKLRYQEILQRREELLAARRAAAESGSAIPDDNDGLPADDDSIDYGELSDQVRHLVRAGYTLGLLAGLWWIWRDVVPALGFLDDVTLPFTTEQLVGGVSKSVPLTLSDVLAGLLFGGLTFLAARNIPGLLELTLLQRLPLSRATRYAITTLTQYLVAIVGLAISFTALGLQWSNIQWLVAALSVGLGFGLQEIVANFVSGVILLFEQPIRVGDVVTVNGVSGQVSRIRIRATTIVNWDRQELIIPNKSFITGELINWSLSDTINRVIISVGVAYGSDTGKAMALMREAAEEHPRVLDDPEPRVTFEEFGDSALTLRLRAYLGELDGRIGVITELHQAIDRKYRDAGIEIPFPQRDVHLDGARPLELVVRDEAGQGL